VAVQVSGSGVTAMMLARLVGSVAGISAPDLTTHAQTMVAWQESQALAPESDQNVAMPAALPEV
jgi:hypothetical protein